MIHPFYPPGFWGYCIITAVCVASMFAAARFLRESFATHIIALLALVPVALGVLWRDRCFYYMAREGFTSSIPLEEIHHRHHISFWSGLICSCVLLVVVTARAAFVSYRRHSG